MVPAALAQLGANMQQPDDGVLSSSDLSMLLLQFEECHGMVAKDYTSPPSACNRIPLPLLAD